MQPADMCVTGPFVFCRRAVYRLQNRLPCPERIGLGQPCHGSLAQFGDGAVVRRELTGHDSQKSGFPSAVRADDADAVAVLEAHRNVAENRAIAQGDPYMLEAEKMCHA